MRVQVPSVTPKAPYPNRQRNPAQTRSSERSNRSGATIDCMGWHTCDNPDMCTFSDGCADPSIDIDTALADFLRGHTATDIKTWANHRQCTCGESYHTMILGRDHAAHVAVELLKEFAIQIALTTP